MQKPAVSRLFAGYLDLGTCNEGSDTGADELYTDADEQEAHQFGQQDRKSVV